MILVGTSGFSYPDWCGPFYPPGCKPQDMLAYYAGHFSLVELDFTYYRMPTARTMAGLSAKTPPSFVFTVKIHKDLTHGRDLSADALRGSAAAFRQALAPLVQDAKLGCVLAQFPWSFMYSSESTEFLAFLRSILPDLPMVVEFRNAGWVQEEAFRFLRDFELGFCCVDEPRLPGLMPPVAKATSSLGYIRFHGRNAAKWWRHDEAWERYDYDYSDTELAEWLPRIAAMAGATEKLFILMNNCHAGQAAKNALRLQALLDEMIA